MAPCRGARWRRRRGGTSSSTCLLSSTGTCRVQKWVSGVVGIWVLGAGGGANLVCGGEEGKKSAPHSSKLWLPPGGTKVGVGPNPLYPLHLATVKSDNRSVQIFSLVWFTLTVILISLYISRYIHCLWGHPCLQNYCSFYCWTIYRPCLLLTLLSNLELSQLHWIAWHSLVWLFCYR